MCLFILMCIHYMQTYADLYRCYCQIYIACFIWDPKPSPSATEEPRNRRQAVWPQPSVFLGNIWCMEDPPKIAHMDLVWLCWSYGKPKRSETKKCVDTNKNRWNHIDLRLVLTMLQCLCMEFIQVEYSLNDIQPPESPCTFPLKYIKILGSRRAWLPTAMVRVHLQPWNSEKPVTVGWCRQMEKSWELVTSVKKHDLPNRRNLSR